MIDVLVDSEPPSQPGCRQRFAHRVGVMARAIASAASSQGTGKTSTELALSPADRVGRCADRTERLEDPCSDVNSTIGYRSVPTDLPFRLATMSLCRVGEGYWS